MSWGFAFGGITIAVVLACLLDWLNKRRWRRLAERRRGENSPLEFERYFAASGISEEILSAVLRELRLRCGPVDEFPVYANDSLAQVYGIVEEDLEWLVFDLHDEICGQEFLPTERPLETVEDLVRILEEQGQARVS